MEGAGVDAEFSRYKSDGYQEVLMVVTNIY